MKIHNAHKSSCLLVVVLSAALAGSVNAQSGAATTSPNRRCEVDEQVGNVGFRIACSNCVISLGASSISRFTTEPTIIDIEPGSPAADVFRTGDVIISVDGYPITTTQGGLRFSLLKPGQNVNIAVRREGEVITGRFSDIPGSCLGLIASRAIGASVGARTIDGVAPARVRSSGRQGGGVGVGQTVAGVVAATVAGRGQGVSIGGGRGTTVTGSGVGQGFYTTPRAGFGFGISCNDCRLDYTTTGDDRSPMIWVFRSPPELYAVEEGTPAYRAGMRRGDVITRVDGMDITTPAGGRRFAQVRPGETVRFNYRRGNDNRTAAVQAENRGRYAIAAGLETAAALNRTQELIGELDRRKSVQQLEQAMKEVELTQRSRLSETLSALREQELEQSRKVNSLQAQVARLQSSLRADLETRARNADIVPLSVNELRTVRYSGRLGNTDVEVRGGQGVVVNETADEIVILAGDATIRIKKRDIR